jgi:hypothetical protein
VEKLRAENWPHHAHTFYFADTFDQSCPAPEPHWVPLDRMLESSDFERVHTISDRENLMVIARKG